MITWSMLLPLINPLLVKRNRLYILTREVVKILFCIRRNAISGVLFLVEFLNDFSCYCT